MNSKIYMCDLEHTRFNPKKHYFKLPIYMYCLDLDELPVLNKKIFFFGYNRFRLTSINDKDYLTKNKNPIKSKILSFVKEAGINTKISKVMLITSAKYLGYIFNPVSFYYCCSSSNQVVAIVAEVNNTFGETHLYILKEKSGKKQKEIYKYNAQKKFFVSPFNNMKGKYNFYFSKISNEINIKIELYRENQIIMNAVLKGNAVEFTSANHLKTIIKHPFLPHLTMPRIIWQATKLFLLRRLPVYQKPVPIDVMTIKKIPPTIFQKICMKIVFNVFSKIKIGSIQMFMPDQKMKQFGDKNSKLNVKLFVHDYKFFSTSVKGGDIGFGESYMKEEWGSDNLTRLIEILINNRSYIKDGNISTTIISKFFNMFLHKRRKNSTRGSKKNIQKHYDQSNEFFSLFLDPGMIYSSAYYNTSKESLAKAQKNKLQMMIKKTQIKKTDHVLEIGCGWGGFAIEAAKTTGCKVTGITVSREQYNYAKERVKKEKLQKQITILLTDYRHIKGKFDKIVSIEMLEAVGHKYYETFFSCCDKLLMKNGLMVIQTISIPDFRYNKYRKSCDWIQKHIFPGGLLPSLTRICQAMTKKTNFIVEHMENIGVHYAKTLEDWRNLFEKNIDKVSEMEFEKYFERKWLYYFCSCEAGFRTRVIGNLQIVFTRSNNTSLPTI